MNKPTSNHYFYLFLPSNHLVYCFKKVVSAIVQLTNVYRYLISMKENISESSKCNLKIFRIMSLLANLTTFILMLLYIYPEKYQTSLSKQKQSEN